MAHLSHTHAVRISCVESKQNISRNNRHKCLRCTSRRCENVAYSEELSLSALFCLGVFWTVWDDGESQDTVQCDQGVLGHKPSAGYLKYDWERDYAQFCHCVYKLSLYFCLPDYFTFGVRERERETECAFVGACVRNCVWMWWMCDGADGSSPIILSFFF